MISTSNASDRPIAWFILSARRPSEDDRRCLRTAAPGAGRRSLQPVRQAHNVGVAMLRLAPAGQGASRVRRAAATRRPGCHEAAPFCRGRDRSPLRTGPRRLAIQRHRRLGGRTAGDRRSGEAGRPPTDASATFARSCGARTRILRPAISGKANDAGSCARWASFAARNKSSNQLLAVRDGAPVYVRDVAEVKLGYKKPDGLVRRFGESSIAINCLRETGANVLDVMDGLRETAQRSGRRCAGESRVCN